MLCEYCEVFGIITHTEKGKGLSKEKMLEIQSQIEADRKKLEGVKDMAEEEKRKVEEDLHSKEKELKEAE